MYLTKAAERLAPATLQVHLAAIVPPTAWSAARSTPATRPSPSCSTASAAPRAPARRARRRRSPPSSSPPWSAPSPTPPLGLRNRAILLAGFGAALRRSEIVALDVGDVELVDGRSVVLTIRRSKTDQAGAGSEVAIGHSADQDLCAPTALARWIAVRQARRPEEALFTGCRGDGTPTERRLSDKAVVRLIQSTAEAVGAGEADLSGRAAGRASRYSGHSLRAGLATAAAEAGANDHYVEDFWRHGIFPHDFKDPWSSVCRLPIRQHWQRARSVRGQGRRRRGSGLRWVCRRWHWPNDPNGTK